MGTQLNEQAYTKLIEQNIEALEKHMPKHSLEKKHTIQVLRWSIREQYHQSKVDNIVLDDVIKCDNCGCDTRVFAEIYGKKRLRYCKECA